MPLACPGRARLAHREHDGVLGDRAQARGDPEGARRGSRPRDVGDFAPRPRRQARSRRRTPRRRGRSSARRRRHAQRGGRRARRHRHRPRAPARRVDQRLRPHARASPTTRSTRRPSSSARSSAAPSSGSASARSTAATSCSTAASASTRPSSPGSSVTRRSSGTPPHPLFVVAAFDTFLRTYDHSQGRFEVKLDSDEVIEGGDAHDRLEDQPVHLPREPTARGRARGRPRFRAERHRDEGTSGFGDAVARRRGDVVAGDAAPASERRASRRGDVRRPSPGADPFPYQVDGDYLGEVQSTRVRLRAGRAHAGRALTQRLRSLGSRPAERPPRDPRRVGDDRVDPELAEPGDHGIGLVDGPDVQRDVERRRRATPRPPRRPRRSRPHADASARWPWSCRDLQRIEPGAGRRRRGSRSARLDRARAPGRSSGGGRRRRAPSRTGPRARISSTTASAARSWRVEVGVARRVLHLHVHEHPGSRRRRPRSRVGIVRTGGPDRRRGRARPGRPSPSTAASWWTTSTPSAPSGGRRARRRRRPGPGRR